MGQSYSFESCFDKSTYGDIWPQSYQTGAGYKGGLYVLKPIFFEQFKRTSESSDNGYFTVRFIISCESKIGQFEILQSSFDFKPMNFTSEVHYQLMDIMNGLTDWQVGKDGHGNKIDSQKFLTFIIKNGSLIDIVPN